MPRVVGLIQRPASVLVGDLRFLRAHTDRTIKITLPGPFTVSQHAQYDYYPDEEQLGSAYADSVNLEVRDLFSAGAALEHVAPERIVIATDCGMKYLPRESVMGKMRAMAAAAGVLRTEFGPG